MELREIQHQLETTLSEKRYIHSLNVAQEAVKLAGQYGGNADKAYLAGLLHDCAKEIAYEKALQLLEKYGIVVDAFLLKRGKLLHGPLGACMAQSNFGISDPEILDAIWYHTTAKANMGLLTKIIYIADFVEPGRTFEGVQELRTAVYQQGLDAGILLGLDQTIIRLVRMGQAIHPDTVHARNYLLMNQEEKR